jgi:hypothetical protein
VAPVNPIADLETYIDPPVTTAVRYCPDALTDTEPQSKIPEVVVSVHVSPKLVETNICLPPSLLGQAVWYCPDALIDTDLQYSCGADVF